MSNLKEVERITDVSNKTTLTALQLARILLEAHKESNKIYIKEN